tara:strand:- start:314 stop:1042 length:729 start_codon:yes stop_codon:yes gene_type:complete
MNIDREKILTKEWLNIKEQLINKYKVDKIILFGSFVTGNIHKWSDIDVAIIKDTDKRYFDRINELCECIQYNIGVQFLIYTPEEIEYAIMDNNFFIKNEILKKGRVIMGTGYGEAKKWLDYAKDDIRSVQSLYKDDIFSHVCFHSQQCVEKCLKAFIRYHNKELPKTHALKDLVELCRELSPQLLNQYNIEIQKLDQYYVPTRYPDAALGSLPDGLPSKSDAGNAKQWANEIFAIISEKIVK